MEILFIRAGVSDHATKLFDFTCSYKELLSNTFKLQCVKYDIKSFEDAWEDINWEVKIENLEVVICRKFIKNSTKQIFKSLVPMSILKPGCEP